MQKPTTHGCGMDSKSPEVKAYKRHLLLLREYGMSLQDYETLLAKQGNACAICKRTETSLQYGHIQQLAVDHCHTTGKVRGLLCVKCNTMLGGAEDSKTTLQTALSYLEFADAGFRAPVISGALAEVLLDELVKI
jgi:hypothetical protein